MADFHVDSLAKLLRDIKAKQPRADDPTVAIVTQTTHDDSAVTVVHDEQIPSTVNAKNIFRHPDAHPLVLDLLLIDKYKEEWLGWEYETLEHVVPRDFGIDRISDLNLSKIQAMKTLHLVDTFWQRWEVFVWCTMPLNATFPDFHVMQVPDVLQCLVAADIARRVREDMEWSEEIKHYLEAVHLHDGILLPQPPLDFVEVDTKGLPVNMGDVIDRWPVVRSSKKAPSGDTPEDEQLRRMLSIRAELERHRAQLRQQLGVLQHA